MTLFEFEIQTLITVRQEGENADAAREKVINRMAAGEFDAEFGGDSCVSDGEVVGEAPEIKIGLPGCTHTCPLHGGTWSCDHPGLCGYPKEYSCVPHNPCDKFPEEGHT